MTNEIDAAALLLRQAILREHGSRSGGDLVDQRDFRQLAAALVTDIATGGTVGALEDRINDTISYHIALRLQRFLQKGQ